MPDLIKNQNNNTATSAPAATQTQALVIPSVSGKGAKKRAVDALLGSSKKEETAASTPAASTGAFGGYGQPTPSAEDLAAENAAKQQKQETKTPEPVKAEGHDSYATGEDAKYDINEMDVTDINIGKKRTDSAFEANYETGWGADSDRNSKDQVIFEGHEEKDEEGNTYYVSGKYDWMNSNITYTNKVRDFIVDGKFHTEDEVKEYEQLASNLYYDYKTMSQRFGVDVNNMKTVMDTGKCDDETIQYEWGMYQKAFGSNAAEEWQKHIKDAEASKAYADQLMAQSKSQYDTLVTMNAYLSGFDDDKKITEGSDAWNAYFKKTGGRNAAAIQEEMDMIEAALARDRYASDATANELPNLAYATTVEDERATRKAAGLLEDDKRNAYINKLNILEEEQKTALGIEKIINDKNRRIDVEKNYFLYSDPKTNWVKKEADLKKALEMTTDPEQVNAINDQLWFVQQINDGDTSKKYYDSWSSKDINAIEDRIFALTYDKKETPTQTQDTTQATDTASRKAELEKKSSALLDEYMDPKKTRTAAEIIKEKKAVDAELEALNTQPEATQEETAVEDKLELPTKHERTPQEELELNALYQLLREKKQEEMTKKWQEYSGKTYDDGRTAAEHWIEDAQARYDAALTASSTSVENYINQIQTALDKNIVNDSKDALRVIDDWAETEGLTDAEKTIIEDIKQYVDDNGNFQRDKASEYLKELNQKAAMGRQSAREELAMAQSKKAEEIAHNADYEDMVAKGRAALPANYADAIAEAQNSLDATGYDPTGEVPQRILIDSGLFTDDAKGRKEAAEFVKYLATLPKDAFTIKEDGSGWSDGSLFQTMLSDVFGVKSASELYGYGIEKALFSDQQKDAFYYLYAKEGPIAAFKYAIGVNNNINSEYQDKLHRNYLEVAEYMADNMNPLDAIVNTIATPFLTSLESMTGLADAIKYADQLATFGATYSGGDPTLSEFSQWQDESAILGLEHGLKLDQKYYKAAEFLYGVYRSSVQSFEVMGLGSTLASLAGLTDAISVTLPTLSGVQTMGAKEAFAMAFSDITFFGSAFADTYRNLESAGVDPMQASKVALYSGLFEAGFEHWSLDNLYNAKNVSNWGSTFGQRLLEGTKETLIQAGIEGSEELFTDIANFISEEVLLGYQSDYQKTIANYMDQYRLTEEQAIKFANHDLAMQLATSFFAGAASGGFSGAVQITRGANAEFSKSTKEYREAIGKKYTDISSNGQTAAQKVAEFINGYEFVKPGDEGKLNESQEDLIAGMKGLAEKVLKGNATDEDVGRMISYADQYDMDLINDLAMANKDFFIVVQPMRVLQAASQAQEKLLGAEEAARYDAIRRANPDSHVATDFEAGLYKALGKDYNMDDANRIAAFVEQVITGNKAITEDAIHEAFESKELSNQAVQQFLFEYLNDRIRESQAQSRSGVIPTAEEAKQMSQESPIFTNIDLYRTTTPEAQKKVLEAALTQVWSTAKDAKYNLELGWSALIHQEFNSMTQMLKEDQRAEEVERLKQVDTEGIIGADNRDDNDTLTEDGVTVTRKEYLEKSLKGINPFTNKKEPDIKLDADTINKMFDAKLIDHASSNQQGVGATTVKFDIKERLNNAAQETAEKKTTIPSAEQHAAAKAEAEGKTTPAAQPAEVKEETKVEAAPAAEVATAPVETHAEAPTVETTVTPEAKTEAKVEKQLPAKPTINAAKTTAAEDNSGKFSLESGATTASITQADTERLAAEDEAYATGMTEEEAYENIEAELPEEAETALPAEEEEKPIDTSFKPYTPQEARQMDLHATEESGTDTSNRKWDDTVESEGHTVSRDEFVARVMSGQDGFTGEQKNASFMSVAQANDLFDTLAQVEKDNNFVAEVAQVMASAPTEVQSAASKPTPSNVTALAIVEAAQDVAKAEAAVAAWSTGTEAEVAVGAAGTEAKGNKRQETQRASLEKRLEQKRIVLEGLLGEHLTDIGSAVQNAKAVITSRLAALNTELEYANSIINSGNRKTDEVKAFMIRRNQITQEIKRSQATIKSLDETLESYNALSNKLDTLRQQIQIAASKRIPKAKGANNGRRNNQTRRSTSKRTNDVVAAGSSGQAQQAATGEAQAIGGTAETGGQQAEQAPQTVELAGVKLFDGNIVFDSDAVTEEEISRMDGLTDSEKRAVLQMLRNGVGRIYIVDGLLTNGQIDPVSGELQRVRGNVVKDENGKDVIVVTRRSSYDSGTIMRHEYVHHMLRMMGVGQRRHFVNLAMEIVFSHNEQLYDEVMDIYKPGYAAAYGYLDDDGNISEESGLIDAVHEEILCDFYAGIFDYGGSESVTNELSEFRKYMNNAVRQYFERSGLEKYSEDMWKGIDHIPQGHMDVGTFDSQTGFAFNKSYQESKKTPESLYHNSLESLSRGTGFEVMYTVPDVDGVTTFTDWLNTVRKNDPNTTMEEAQQIFRDYIRTGKASVVGLGKRRGSTVTPVENVKAADVVNTPLARLVKAAEDKGFISKDEANRQYGFIADILNLINKYKDSEMIWEVLGSELYAAIKNNSDPQYGRTIDFSTICKKTQQIIDVIGKTMEELGTGLSKEEIKYAYQKVGLAGESTPCPVCYVFSRWMGLGSVLDNINTFQNRYGLGQEAELMDMLNRVYEAAIYEMENDPKKGTDKQLTFGKAVNKAQENIDSQIAKALKSLALRREAEENIAKLSALVADWESKFDTLSNSRKDKLRSNQNKLAAYRTALSRTTDEWLALIDDLNNRSDEFDAYKWAVKARVTEDKDNPGTFTIRDDFKPVPPDVLFNLNRGEEFAKNYPGSWAYRTSRGSGLGKAILPYSDARVGETIQGVITDAKNVKKGVENPFSDETEMTPEAQDILDKAIKRMAAQNNIGGMRYQSTSDFRYEYASDYLLTFFEMQAMGANVQLYTKVIEAVDFFAAVGCDVNLSVMPKGKGIGVLENKPADWDTNYDRYYTYENNKYTKLQKGEGAPEFVPGKYHEILYSDVTGVNGGAAREYVQKYDNVQMIMVGISPDHINACLDSDDITFVIPFHGSGNTTRDIQQLMNLLHEDIDILDIMDFADYENDHELTANNPARDLREKIVTGAFWDEKTETRIPFKEGSAERELLKTNRFLRDLYRRFYLDVMTDGVLNTTKSQQNYQAEDLQDIDFGNDEEFYKKYYLNGINECYLTFQPGGDTAKKIFPYEYWDKSLKQSEAKANGDAFIEYCASLGLQPRFSGRNKSGTVKEECDFTKNPNYWKLLIDRKMYDNNGNYRAQRKIDLSRVAVTDRNQATDEFGRYNFATANPVYGEANFGDNSEFANRVNPGREKNSVMSKVNDRTKTDAIAQSVAQDIRHMREMNDNPQFTPDADIRQAMQAADPILAALMLKNEAAEKEAKKQKRKNSRKKKDTGKHSLDMLDTSVLERYAQEDLIDLSTWNSDEHPRLHPDLKRRMQKALSLNRALITYFEDLDENNPLRYTEDEINDLMAFNLFNGNIDGDDMPRASELVYALSDISKEQKGWRREQTYQLMNDLIPHLSITEADRWTEKSTYNQPANEDFYEWYIDRNPVKEVKYRKQEKQEEQKQNNVRSWEDLDEIEKLYRTYKRGFITYEEFLEQAKEVNTRRAAEAMQSKHSLDSGVVDMGLKLVQGHNSVEDFKAIFEKNPEVNFVERLINETFLDGERGAKRVQKDFVNFIKGLDTTTRQNLVSSFENYLDAAYLPVWISEESAAALKNRLRSILNSEINKKEYIPLTDEEIDSLRSQFLSAVQKIQDRDGSDILFAWDEFEKTLTALRNLYDVIPSIDYLSRLANAETAKEKKQIRAEFEKLLSGITDYNALWYLANYSKYCTEAYVNKDFGNLRKQKAAQKLFSNIIEARRDQILLEHGESTNVKLMNREYSVQEMRSMFDQLNRNKAVAELADKVFPIAEGLGLTIRGVDGKRLKGDVYGHAYGSVVEYNINRFNDTGVTNQQKASTILHELIHSCTTYALRGYKNPNLNVHLTEDMKQACRQIYSVWEEIARDPEFKNRYGATNVYEMLAELSNPKFREALERKSLWDRIVDALKRFFGIDTKNALDATSVALDYLLDNIDYKGFLDYARIANRQLDTSSWESIPKAEEAVTKKLREEWQKKEDMKHSVKAGNLYLRESYLDRIDFDDSVLTGKNFRSVDEAAAWVRGLLRSTGDFDYINYVNTSTLPDGSSYVYIDHPDFEYESEILLFVPEEQIVESNFSLDGVEVYDNRATEQFTNSNGDQVTVGKFSLDPEGITSVTYFAGSGTLDYALRDRVFHLFAVEYDPEIRDMFIKNNGNSVMVTDADVNDVRPGTVIAGHVDYFHASPVCKNFSMANNKSGETDLDRSFANSIVKGIRAWMPKVFTLENVKGYLGSDSLKTVTDTLTELGYKWDVDVYRASDYGAATIRDRLFVRAALDGELPAKPIKTEATSWWDAVEDIVDTLPVMDDSGLTASRRNRLEKMGIDINNLEQPILLLSGTKGGEIQYAYADQPSPTLMTDGSEARIILTNGTILKVTPRVYARIQGLDDEFILPVKRNGETHQTNAFKILGNGVPTQLTQAVVNPLLDIIDKQNGKYSVDDEQMASTLQMYEDLIDPSEWKASEHQNMNERMYNRISNGISLWDKVVSFYDTVDEDNYNWLSYEDITQAMRINPYNGNVDGEDMPLASEVMWSLLHLARDQGSDVKERIYRLMEEIAPHLMRTEQDKWIRPVSSRFPPIDFDFSNWYNERNPMPEVGYTPKPLEQLHQEAIEATNEANFQRRAYRRSLATGDEYNRAAEKARRAWNMYSTRFNAEQGKGKFSVDIDPDAAFDSFGYEVELDDYSPVVTQSDLSENLYYSEDGNTAYYMTDTGETVILNNVGTDSPEMQFINSLEAQNNANSINNPTTQPYPIPAANRNEYNGYRIGEQNDSLRRGTQEVPAPDQERTLRSAGSYGERNEARGSQSSQQESLKNLYSLMFGEEKKNIKGDPTRTLYNHKGEKITTEDVYPLESFERFLFKAAASGDYSSIEDAINKYLDKTGGFSEKEIDLFERMIDINNAYTDEQREAWHRALDEAVAKYGIMKPKKGDKNPNVVIPKKTDDGQKTRGHVRNVAANADSEILTERLQRERMMDALLGYTPLSNAKSLDAAERIIEREGGLDGAMAYFEAIVRSGKVPTAADVALGDLLISEFAKDPLSIDKAAKLVTEMSIMGTNLGQAVQAMAIIKKMTAKGQLYYLEGVVRHLNKVYEKRINDPKNKMTEIKISDALKIQLLSASTEQQINDAVEAIKDDLAKQIPPTWVDKWNAWRYLAMLGNPRTHIRNMVGNGAFMPAVFIKDMVARELEKNTNWIDESARTKVSGRTAAEKEAFVKYAQEDYKVMVDILKGKKKGSKFVDANDIVSRRQIFDTKFLDELEKYNGNKLEGEDLWFMEKYYVRTLAEALQAKGVKMEDLKDSKFSKSAKGKKILNEARAWAVREAQRDTYHDANAFAATLNQLKSKNVVANVLLEGLVPFTKTPLNIMKRAIEYSPIGLISSAIDLRRELRSGNKNTAEILDRMAAGLTGTGIMILGAFLSAIGLLRGIGPDEDKEDEFEKLQGHQNWSIELPFFGNKKASYTIDWMAPMALPLFVGGTFWDLLNGEVSLESAWDIGKALSTLADPMLAMSMLDGLENTLSSIASANDASSLSTLLTSMATSYVAQGMPTLFGQIARTIDDTRRSTYVDKNNSTPSGLQRFLQTSILGKIPLVESTKMAYVDEWGRTDTQDNILLRALENFVSPGYANFINETPVDTELGRLAEAIGGKEGLKVLPGRASKSIGSQNQGKDEEGNPIKIDEKDLTADEYEKYATITGQASYQLLADMFATQEYQEATDSEKYDMVLDAFDYADSLAKREIIPERNMDSNWMDTAEKFGPADFIVIRQNYEDNKANERIYNWIASDPRLSAEQVSILLTDKMSIPNYVDSTEDGIYKFQLNNSDDAPIESLYQAMCDEGLPKLFASKEYIEADGDGKAALMQQFATDTKAAALAQYSTTMSELDHKRVLKNASSVGKEAFNRVLDVSNDPTAQADWIWQYYSPDKMISNPDHPGYAFELDQVQRGSTGWLVDSGKALWEERYNQIINSDKFKQNKNNRDYLNDMIEGEFYKFQSELEDEYARQLAKSGAAETFKDKPTGYKTAEAFDIAYEQFGNDPDAIAMYVAQTQSMSTALKNPNRPGYFIVLPTEDQTRGREYFDSMFAEDLSRNWPYIMAQPAEKRGTAVKDMMDQTAKHYVEQYGDMLDKEGYDAQEIRLTGNTDEFNQLMANENFSKQQAIDLIVEKYAMNQDSENWEAKDFKVNTYRTYVEQNYDKFIVNGTPEEFEKLRSSYKRDRGAAWVANEAVKTLYGVSKQGDIPLLEHSYSNISDVSPRTYTPSTSSSAGKSNTSTSTASQFVIPPAESTSKSGGVTNKMQDTTKYRRFW